MCAPIRTRPIGSNACSDRYTKPRAVEGLFRDLALFIGHTGFTNIRRRPLPAKTLPCPSLAAAWRLVVHGALRPPNALWYVVDSHAFVVAVVREPVSACATQILSLQEGLGPFDVWFRPEPLWCSVDDFIEATLLRAVHATLGGGGEWQSLCHTHGGAAVSDGIRAYRATVPCYHALLFLFPSAGLTRSRVNNRLNKTKKQLLRTVAGTTAPVCSVRV
jgi:hypothetical protein